jgi:hypothetical protein
MHHFAAIRFGIDLPVQLLGMYLTITTTHNPATDLG